jgi:hypothetical protein
VTSEQTLIDFFISYNGLTNPTPFTVKPKNDGTIFIEDASGYGFWTCPEDLARALISVSSYYAKKADFR